MDFASPVPPPSAPSRLDRFEQRHGRTWFLILCAFIAFAAMQVLTFPTAYLRVAFLGTSALAPDHRFIASFLPLCSAPLSGQTPEFPQTRLRILGQILGYLLYLRTPLAAALITWLASLPALYLGAGLARRFVSPAQTLAFTLLLGTLHPLVIANTWPGFQDSLAATLVLLCMTTRRIWALAPLMFLAMLADERSILSGLIILCWHAAFERNLLTKNTLLRTLAFGAALLAWAAYAVLLVRHLQLTMHDVRGAAIDYAWTFLEWVPMSIYFTFRSGWLWALLGGWALWVHGKRALAAILTASALFIIAAAFVVGDTSRAVAHVFPAVFIGLAAIAAHRRAWVTPLLAATLTLNIIQPTVTGVSYEWRTLQSLPGTVLIRLAKVANLYKPFVMVPADSPSSAETSSPTMGFSTGTTRPHAAIPK